MGGGGGGGEGKVSGEGGGGGGGGGGGPGNPGGVWLPLDVGLGTTLAGAETGGTEAEAEDELESAHATDSAASWLDTGAVAGTLSCWGAAAGASQSLSSRLLPASQK